MRSRSLGSFFASLPRKSFSFDYEDMNTINVSPHTRFFGKRDSLVLLLLDMMIWERRREKRVCIFRTEQSLFRTLYFLPSLKDLPSVRCILSPSTLTLLFWLCLWTVLSCTDVYSTDPQSSPLANFLPTGSSIQKPSPREKVPFVSFKNSTASLTDTERRGKERERARCSIIPFRLLFFFDRIILSVITEKGPQRI